MKIAITATAYGPAYPTFERFITTADLREGIPHFVQRAQCSVIFGRNSTFNAALNWGADVIFNVDPDNVTSINRTLEIMRKLVRHRVDLVSAVYAARCQNSLVVGRPYPLQPAFVPLHDEQIPLGENGGLKEVRRAAFGMTAISGSMLREVADHFPRAKNVGGRVFVNHKTCDEQLLTDDYSFCDAIRKLGRRCYVDTSTKVGHLKELEIAIPDCLAQLQSA
jgi:hypothetical protein